MPEPYLHGFYLHSGQPTPEVKSVIKQGWQGGRFVLTTDALDINTPAEYLNAFIKATRECGPLPLKI